MLEPYRVLDLTDERGLMAGLILADLGADVIAVEPPGGSPARRIGPFFKDQPDPNGSLYWWAFSRNKRSVTLDIERSEGRAALLRLVEGADFLVESFGHGYLDRLGLGWGALSAINPRLVMASITPFGQDGPKADWAATDLTVMAASGALLITGDDDRPPVRVSVPQAFLHAGAEAATAMLIAHAARERDGVGQHIDASAQTAAMMATQSFVLQAAWGDRPLERMAGGVKLGPIKLQLVNPCKDGYVTVTFLFGTAIGPFSRRLMEVMYADGFVDAATRDKDWIGYTLLLLSGQEPISELDRCIDAIRRWTLSHTKAELLDLALRHGLLIVPISTTADLVHSPQLAARDYWAPIAHPDLEQTFLYPGPFAKLSATPLTYRRRPPLVGEHNAEILTSPPRPSSRSAGTPLAPLGPRGGPSQGRGRAAESSLPSPARPGAAPGRAAPTGSIAESSLPSPARGGAGGEVPLPALAGVKVLDFTWVMVGPMGVRYLADYGATVVHVESATKVDTARTIGPYKDGQPGPERSGLYANVNTNKLGITLNLALPEARELALRLVRWADVVAESFSPKAMRSWGLGYEALRAVNPGIIMLSSCLNGQTGPYAPLAGFGTMGAALAGFGELAGWPDRPPAGPFGAYTDYVAPKFIASALLAALDHRRRTGAGQHIDLSQAEASINFLAPALLDYTVNGRVQSRTGNASAEHAPHGVYPCRGSGQSAVEHPRGRSLLRPLLPTPDCPLPPTSGSPSPVPMKRSGGRCAKRRTMRSGWAMVDSPRSPPGRNIGRRWTANWRHGRRRAMWTRLNRCCRRRACPLIGPAAVRTPSRTRSCATAITSSPWSTRSLVLSPSRRRASTCPAPPP